MRFNLIPTLLTLLPALALAADYNRADFHKPGSYSLYMPFRGDSINCQLAENNNSNTVKALQQQMNLCRGKSLNVDGDFGPRTRRAMQEVQRSVGVDDDGILWT